MKKILIFTFIIMITLSGCSKQDTNTLEAIKSKGQIIMGTSGDYPPNEFHIMIDGKDELVGYDIELGNYIADRLGVELIIKEMEFGNLLSSLDIGQIDMIIAGIGDEPGRDANFTISYDDTGVNNILTTKKNSSSIKEISDLKDKTIAAQMGSIQKKLLENIEGINIKETQNIDNLILELKTAKIDGVLVSQETAELYVASNNDLCIIDKLDFISENSEGAAVALKKGNDTLTKEINDIILEIKSNGLLEIWKSEAQKLADKN